MRTTIHERLGKSVGEQNLDGIVLLAPQSFTHATGVRVPSQLLMRWRHAAALLTPSGLDSVLVVDMEEITVREALPAVPMRVWREFHDNAMLELGKLISERVGTKLRLGIETDFIPTQAFTELRENLPDVEWVPCQSLVESSRLAKTDSELSILRELVKITDGALASALYETRPGDSEVAVGRKIINALYANAIDEHRTLIVTSGSRTQYANVGPSEKSIDMGDLVRVEVFSARDGFQAGVARTAVMGTPRKEVTELWKHLSGAREAGLAAIHPGADPVDIYNQYAEALGPLAEYKISFFGHGMGLDVHERPYISPVSRDPIVEGSVIAVEPFAMLPGRFGMQVKDVLAVTSQGYEMLSDRLDGGSLIEIR